MNTSRVTIRVVAQEAGVSVTTVSHALNGKGKVSFATAERVRLVAEQLGYRPSATAQALRTGRTGAIALVLPQENPEAARGLLALDYYMQIAATAASTAFDHNRPLILPPAISTAEDWARINPDGVLLCDPVENDPRIDLLESSGIPVVTIERDSGRPDWPYYVSGDNVANTREVLDHLRAAGARRVALLTTDWSRAWAHDIEDAYGQWCQENGQDEVRATVPMRIEVRDAFGPAAALLDSANPPDAFYAPAEGYSTGVVKACAERGLRIPDDVLLVCGNDSRESRQSDPPITAVDLRPQQQTAAAIKLLIARISGLDVTAPVIVSSQLNVRASTTR
ncbi:LacI family DNA-binding transcriptional regulator [Aeromicrobium sp. UC242_57]|uniref:LacI family DNA-binding transcriptional regulator n=1 Tax=Aeromicrobium sp. UC242_57 TaxID=3374624 RepID=UPI0037A43499